MTGNTARSLNYLTHGEALAITKVIDHAVFFLERRKRQQVGIREVADVNIVAYAGAIRRRIIGSVNPNTLPSAQRNVQDQRDQVRLRFMRFPAPSNRASDIEVTQAGVAEAVDAMQPGQHLLHQQLRFAVRIGGVQRCIFLDWRPFGLAVNGCG